MFDVAFQKAILAPAELVPAFEEILGAQPKPDSLGSRENNVRFSQVFVRLIQTLATAEHPLVVFLDDLQWADPSSLHMLQAILEHRDTKYLLIIGAYRDNEVDAAHILQMTINELQKIGVQPKTLTLEPLVLTEVGQLLADTLHMTIDQVQTLAEICHSRTEGNPFFLNQSLQSGIFYHAFSITISLSSFFIVIVEPAPKIDSSVGVLDLHITPFSICMNLFIR